MHPFQAIYPKTYRLFQYVLTEADAYGDGSPESILEQNFPANLETHFKGFNLPYIESILSNFTDAQYVALQEATSGEANELKQIVDGNTTTFTSDNKLYMDANPSHRILSYIMDELFACWDNGFNS